MHDTRHRRRRGAVALLAGAALAEGALLRLGRAYGSTRTEVG
jgi:hypothetical protein